MNRKAILLHMHDRYDFRSKMTILHMLYTIYTLRQVNGVDIILHSINGSGKLFKQLNIPNLIVDDELICDEEICQTSGIMFYSRLNAFASNITQKYDEIIVLDNDLELNMNSFQEFINSEMNDSEHVICKTYINEQKLLCIWFALLKVNMKVLKMKIDSQLIDTFVQKHLECNGKNYEENVFARIVNSVDGNIVNVKELDWKDGTIVTKHYHWDVPLSRKIEYVFKIVQDIDFALWVRNQGIEPQYHELCQQIFSGLLKKYVDMFNMGA